METVVDNLLSWAAKPVKSKHTAHLLWKQAVLVWRSALEGGGVGVVVVENKGLY